MPYVLLLPAQKYSNHHSNPRSNHQRYHHGKHPSHLLQDGKRVEPIDLKKALGVVAKIGLTIRNPPRPNVENKNKI